MALYLFLMPQYIQCVCLFVLDDLRPSQGLFSHVSSCVEQWIQLFSHPVSLAEDKVSCSRTQQKVSGVSKMHRIMIQIFMGTYMYSNQLHCDQLELIEQRRDDK